MLAHGKSAFHGAFQRSVLPAGARDEPFSSAPDDVSGSAQCSAWIADDRRKAFLADVGVGTLDQALLGVLPAKHQAIRIAALARRVLVATRFTATFEDGARWRDAESRGALSATDFPLITVATQEAFLRSRVPRGAVRVATFK